MGSPNGGIIGVINPTSFGKCTVTTKTSSAPSAVTTQPGTRLIKTLIVAGGGGELVNVVHYLLFNQELMELIQV
jgi:hypothetical protein